MTTVNCHGPRKSCSPTSLFTVCQRFFNAENAKKDTEFTEKFYARTVNFQSKPLTDGLKT
jgi:hypothetical protein